MKLIKITFPSSLENLWSLSKILTYFCGGKVRSNGLHFFRSELIPVQRHSRLILGIGYSGDAAQEELQKIMDYKVLRGLDPSQEVDNWSD